MLLLCLPTIKREPRRSSLAAISAGQVLRSLRAWFDAPIPKKFVVADNSTITDCCKISITLTPNSQNAQARLENQSGQKAARRGPPPRLLTRSTQRNSNRHCVTSGTSCWWSPPPRLPYVTALVALHSSVPFVRVALEKTECTKKHAHEEYH